MANIDNELLEICAASAGKDVRRSIVKALKRINEDRSYAESTFLKITDDDNHKTIEGGPWSKIFVEVGQTGEGTGITLDNFGVVKKNGHYDLWNTNWTPGHGWSSFTVDIEGASYTSGEKSITANGEYSASSDGYDGYSKVKVNIPNGGQEGQAFKVRFYDQFGSMLEVLEVAYGGTAQFSGTLPESDTPFVGWNPEPVNVTYNMECYPIFWDAGYRGTIKDDWKTIQYNMINGTALEKYHIGDSRMMPCQGFSKETEMVLLDIGDVINVHDESRFYSRKKVNYYETDEENGIKGVVSLWISKEALYDTRIDPDSVLDQNKEDINVSGNISSDAQSVGMNLREGPATWNAVQYSWYEFGMSYDKSDGGRITPFKIPYEHFSNGGAAEFYNYYNRLVELGINRNKFMNGGAMSQNVDIVLETPCLGPNSAALRVYWDPDMEMYCSEIIIPFPNPRRLHSYRGDIQGHITEYTSITANNPNYEGSEVNPNPTRETSAVLKEFEWVDAINGFSREFLIL